MQCTSSVMHLNEHRYRLIIKQYEKVYYLFLLMPLRHNVVM